MESFKSIQKKYDELEEMAERKVMELKRLHSMVTQFPPHGNSVLVTNELESAIESLQKPIPDYKSAGIFITRANALLDLEGGFHE